MPLPMVHLFLAKGVEEKLEFKHSPYYYLGNIAPDSIHSRNGTTRRDKHHTHLYVNTKDISESQALTKKKIKEMLEVSLKNKDKSFVEFSYGYAVHSLFDMMWIKNIFRPFDRSLRTSGLNYDDVRRIYYDETKACDLKLYEENIWMHDLLVELKNTEEFDFYDILSKDEIHRWKDVTIEKMWNPQNNYIVEPYYITIDHITAFVSKVIHSIADYFDSNGFIHL